MDIALLNRFNADVVSKVWGMVPLQDITVKVMHLSRACQLESDEYYFGVPVGPTVAEIKGRLLDAEFRQFNWLADEMVMWEECCPM